MHLILIFSSSLAPGLTSVFSVVTALPLDAISRSDYVSLALTSGGGHVAHLNGINPYNTPFYVEVAVDFLHAVANNTQDLPTV